MAIIYVDSISFTTMQCKPLVVRITDKEVEGKFAQYQCKEVEGELHNINVRRMKGNCTISI